MYRNLKDAQETTIFDNYVINGLLESLKECEGDRFFY